MSSWAVKGTQPTSPPAGHNISGKKEIDGDLSEVSDVRVRDFNPSKIHQKNLTKSMLEPSQPKTFSFALGGEKE